MPAFVFVRLLLVPSAAAAVSVMFVTYFRAALRAADKRGILLLGCRAERSE